MRERALSLGLRVHPEELSICVAEKYYRPVRVGDENAAEYMVEDRFA
jgi:hypothetical protein